MNKQDIEKNIIWNEYGVGYVDVLLPIFGKEIQFELFSEDDKNPTISAKMFATIEDVLNLPIDSIERIKELLWEECNFSFAVSDYGCEVREGETIKDAHFREFEINDLQDSYDKSKVEGVQITYESDELNGRYAVLLIEAVTDELLNVIIKNGKIIDYDHDGTYLGWFETDEQKRHKDRMKTLNE